MLIKAAAAAAGFLLLGSAAQAQMVTAEPQNVRSALQAAGYSAELGTDGEGDPMITSASSGKKFGTFFFGCTEHKGCTNLQFYTAYTVKKKVSLDQLNSWNRGHRFARAFLDKEGDPALAMDLDVDKGGLSRALFGENLNTWTELMAAFEKEIGF